MKILFDHGTPVPLKRHLPDHSVSTAFELGWSKLSNGDLLNAAEIDGFEVLITTDQNLRYQQNLASRRIAIVVIRSASWPRIQSVIDEIVAAINRSATGTFEEIPVD